MMTENIFEMARKSPDLVLKILETEMKHNLYTSEEMWKEGGIDEVIPDMVILKAKLKGLEKLVKNWEIIERVKR